MEWMIGLCVVMAAAVGVAVWRHRRQQDQRRSALLHSKQAAARSKAASHHPTAHSTPVPMSQPPAAHGPRVATAASPVTANAVPKSRIQKLTWIGAGHRVSMAGLTLESPLAYFFDSRCRLLNEEPAAIDFGLPVAPAAASPTERELPYWPKYAELTPAQRRIYLEWMAGRRKSIPIELGYTFLFIYGLERRTLVEDVDHKLVFDELLRLRDLYAGANLSSRSFGNYTLSLLCFLIVLAPQTIALKLHSTPGGCRWYMGRGQFGRAAGLVRTDQHAAAGLGGIYVVAKGLTAIATQRCHQSRRRGEFQRLFCKRYTEQFGEWDHICRFPNGHESTTIDPQARHCLPMTVSAANPLGISSQFKVLSQLWNQGIVELRKLSSAVAKSEGRNDSCRVGITPDRTQSGDRSSAGEPVYATWSTRTCLTRAVRSLLRRSHIVVSFGNSRR